MGSAPMSSTTSPFGRVLRRFRIAAGLSQEELAEAAGLSVRGISDLERGARTSPRLETVRLLADALVLDDERRAELLTAARPETAVRDAASSSEQQTPNPQSLSFPPLPFPPTRLVGRQAELDEICRLLTGERTRLVTLTGQGGIGKTRLALAAAHSLAPDFGDGVTFIDLSPVRNPTLVPGVIAGQLGVRSEMAEPPREAIASLIGGRACLLVLDNWEQVLEEAPLVASLLARCPKLRVLATSREPLRLRGEWEIRLDPLSVPDLDDLHRDEALMTLAEAPAIQLFLDRAAEATGGFSLSAENATPIAEICRRLEGLPLAIELAAARCRLFPPDALLARLSSRLQLLTEGPRDMPERLQTMRNAIAWSHELLEVTEREVLNALGVFVGGFTLRAATIVLGQAGLAPADLERSLASLVNKSLLQIRPSPDAIPRYAMFETIREFALERLAESGRLADVRHAHAGWVLDFAERAEPALTGPDPLPTFHQLEPEVGNIRTALAWLIDQNRADDALRLAGALAWFWTEPRYLREGRQWLDTLLALDDPGVPAAVRAKALVAAGDLAQWQGDIAAAARFHEEGYLIWKELGDRERMAGSLRSLASAALGSGDFDQADHLLVASRELARELGNRWEVAATTNLLGLSVVFQGNAAAGIERHREAIELWEELGDADHVVAAYGALAWAHTMHGDWEDAVVAYAQALERAHQVEDSHQIAWNITGTGVVALLRDDNIELGIQLLAAAAAIRERIGTTLWFKHAEVIEQLVAQVRARIGEPRYQELAQQGRALEDDAVIALARSLH